MIRTPWIRIDALWLATQPIDMRAGADTLLARVVQVFGCAQAHHGYLLLAVLRTRVKMVFRARHCPAWGSARLVGAASSA